MAIGIEFIDEQLKENHAVCLGLITIDSATDVASAELLNDVVRSLLELDYDQLCFATISDAAARGVANEFDHDEDICMMYLYFYYFIANLT